jgi:hypothetical protein
MQATFQSRRGIFWSFALAFAFVASSLAVSAQDEPGGCSAASNQPSDIALRLSLKNGQTVFREGEIIALTAEYKADRKNKYILSNRSYDRSGRLDGMEVFCITLIAGRIHSAATSTEYSALWVAACFPSKIPARSPMWLNSN